MEKLRRATMMSHHEPTLERRYALMGETLLFQTNHSALLEAAEDAFGRFPIWPDTNAQPLVVRLFIHEPSSDQLRRQDGEHPQPIFRTQGHLFSVMVGGSNLAVADLQQGFAYGYVTPQIASDRAFVRYTFVEGLGYGMLSMARDYVPVHAACVVKDGVAVLLQAHAGTGKSTLAYACIKRGDCLLAEDVVHVKHFGTGLQLWGAPWRFHLLPDVKDFFPELADQQVHLQMNGEWKMELDLEELFPGSTVVRADPGVVVMLSRAKSDKTHLQHLNADAALSEFEVLWPWNTGWTEAHERQIASLIDEGAYRLVMNGTPEEAVDEIDRLVELHQS